MRTTVKLAVPLAIAAVLALGLLPPLFARGELDGFARDAAQKGSSVLLNEGQSEAQALVVQAIASHPGVHLDKVAFEGNNTVAVTISEDVHTFLSTFHLSTTEGSSLGD
ncbi:MAG TPA: hypothetical protein VKR22_02565 [Acidimicrobiales bacterium]|nr:hypothetical protein [Acidimicrobiales bacterium]